MIKWQILDVIFLVIDNKMEEVMKKILVGLVMFLTVNVYGQLKPATQQPMYQARTLN